MEDFTEACKSGNVDLAKQLYNTANLCINSAFDKACQYDCTEVAKWLHTSGADMSFNNYNPLIFACKNSNVEIIKMMHNSGYKSRNGYCFAFIFVCGEGNIEIAKLLHNLGASIRGDQNAAFKLACKNEHIEIARWQRSSLPLGDKVTQFR